MLVRQACRVQRPSCSRRRRQRPVEQKPGLLAVVPPAQLVGMLVQGSVAQLVPDLLEV